jgi:hypothetical protein
MIERRDAITNEVLEPNTFVLAYPTAFCYPLPYDVRKNMDFYVSWLRPLVLLIRAVRSWRCEQYLVDNTDDNDDRAKPKFLDRKTYKVPLCPPKISQGLTWGQTQASAVRDQRHIGRAKAGPVKADSDIPCRSHAVSLPCRSATAFPNLWSADHRWTSGSALVVLLHWTLVLKRQKK